MVPTPPPAYGRAILKLSGEMLSDPESGSIVPSALSFISRQVKETRDSGVELGIVCGGGNIVRGRDLEGLEIDRVTADQMGMLATVINGLALRQALEKSGLEAALFTSLPTGPLAEPYSPRAARAALGAGKVAVFAGGTGNPFVTTDTAAVLRACDIGAGVVLKATKVDGIYSADPVADPAAQRFDEITYDRVLELGLKIMDYSAIGLAKENNIPVFVFKFREEHALQRAVSGEGRGTLMQGGDR